MPFFEARFEVSAVVSVRHKTVWSSWAQRFVKIMGTLRSVSARIYELCMTVQSGDNTVTPSNI